MFVKRNLLYSFFPDEERRASRCLQDDFASVARIQDSVLASHQGSTWYNCIAWVLYRCSRVKIAKEKIASKSREFHFRSFTCASSTSTYRPPLPNRLLPRKSTSYSRQRLHPLL
jgi:hypothetical protein